MPSLNNFLSGGGTGASATGVGSGLLEQINKLMNPSWQYNTTHGPRPKGTMIDRMKAESARQKAAADARKQQTQSRQSSIDEILSRLGELQNPSRYMPDQAEIDRQAGLAGSQYEAAIAGLRSQMGNAQSRASRFDTQLNDMYTSLSSNLQGSVPQVQQQFTDTKQQTGDQYKQLESAITDQYARSQAEQEAMYKRLNIEAAAEGTMPEQMRDKDFFVNTARSQGNTMQTALGQEERGATEFSRQGSQIASAEGTNRRADLQAQLQEMMAAFESQIGQQEAAKAAAVNEARSSLSGAMQKNALDRAQQDFQNYISMIKLGQDLKGSQAGGKAVQSPADVAQRALGMGLGPGESQRLQDVFMSGLGGNEMILGGLNPETGTAATKEALARQIVESGRQQGMTQAQLNVLQTIALEYFGRS